MTTNVVDANGNEKKRTGMITYQDRKQILEESRILLEEVKARQPKMKQIRIDNKTIVEVAEGKDWKSIVDKIKLSRGYIYNELIKE